MSARRPLYRVRHDPIIDMWVVSATERAQPDITGSTAYPSWHKAMRFVQWVAEMRARARSELDTLNA